MNLTSVLSIPCIHTLSHTTPSALPPWTCSEDEAALYSQDNAAEHKNLILSGHYQLNDPAGVVQTFRNVDHEARYRAITIVRLEILNNHDNPYTCLYRFRVHGD